MVSFISNKPKNGINERYIDMTYTSINTSRAIRNMRPNERRWHEDILEIKTAIWKLTKSDQLVQTPRTSTARCLIDDLNRLLDLNPYHSSEIFNGAIQTDLKARGYIAPYDADRWKKTDERLAKEREEVLSLDEVTECPECTGTNLNEDKTMCWDCNGRDMVDYAEFTEGLREE
tara:strand:+ start:596 stop:1117 length:522 start_codon:yes stop_codon:yes gene_type:complete